MSPHPLAFLADVAGRGPRCAIHGDDTSSGRCGSCDQVAYDQAEAHLEAQRDAAEARAQHDADRAEAWEAEHEPPERW